MTSSRVERLVWSMTILTVVSGTVIIRGEVSSLRVRAVGRLALSSPSAMTARTPAAADDRVRAIVDGDLFRRERRRDSVPTAPATPVAPRPPAPPKPHLVLRGVVGGPPWNAILDGIPGRDGGYVVRAGDSVNGLKIRSVQRDGATIRGMDTIWVLKLGGAP